MTTNARQLATALIAAAAIAIGVAVAPAAGADPSDDCDTCTHDPQQWNGPLLPTWDTPHSNEGWTTLPQLCDPVTYQCRQVATP
jgi:hypothetical protein